jgi:hypothetical protein
MKSLQINFALLVNRVKPGLQVLRTHLRQTLAMAIDLSVFYMSGGYVRRWCPSVGKIIIFVIVKKLTFTIYFIALFFVV